MNINLPVDYHFSRSLRNSSLVKPASAIISASKPLLTSSCFGTFKTKNHLTLPISGTGSAGMESAICNLVEKGDDVIVCVNGFFGARMKEMVQRCGGNPITVEAQWGRVIRKEDIEKALSESDAKVVTSIETIFELDRDGSSMRNTVVRRSNLSANSYVIANHAYTERKRLTSLSPRRSDTHSLEAIFPQVLRMLRHFLKRLVRGYVQKVFH